MSAAALGSRRRLQDQEHDWLEQDWLDCGPHEISREPTLEQLRFRKSVSMFATGIVVLSCEDDDGQVHGMTVNSFTSVSLQPPTVLVSLTTMTLPVMRRVWPLGS